MSENPVEEYTIDLDDPEATLKSLKVKQIIILDENGEKLFSYPRSDDLSLYRLVNAYISLFTHIEPWTMIENSGRRAYIFKNSGKIVAVEAEIPPSDFDALREVIADLIKRLSGENK